jgi:hypothetical protein
MDGGTRLRRPVFFCRAYLRVQAVRSSDRASPQRTSAALTRLHPWGGLRALQPARTWRRCPFAVGLLGYAPGTPQDNQPTVTALLEYCRFECRRVDGFAARLWFSGCDRNAGRPCGRSIDVNDRRISSSDLQFRPKLKDPFFKFFLMASQPTVTVLSLGLTTIA